MKELLLESPMTLGVVGLLMTALVGFFWTQTGYKSALATAVGFALATVVLVGISLQIETDREKIEKTLHTVAAALQRNDYEAVYSAIHPNATAGVARARGELPNYVFDEARVTHVKKIAVESTRKPPTAIAEFNVRVGLKLQGQDFNVPRFIKVYFLKEGDRWLVQDYEHFEPTAGFRNTEQGIGNPEQGIGNPAQ